MTVLKSHGVLAILAAAGLSVALAGCGVSPHAEAAPKPAPPARSSTRPAHKATVQWTVRHLVPKLGQTVQVSMPHGPLPHPWKDVVAVGELHALKISGKLPVPEIQRSGTAIIPWGIAYWQTARVAGKIQETVNVLEWKGQVRPLLESVSSETPPGSTEDSPVEFAEANASEGAWSAGPGLALMQSGTSGTTFLWWNLQTGTFTSITSPNSSPANYPSTVYAGNQWAVTWESGAGKAFEQLHPEALPQSLPDNFSAMAGHGGRWFGELQGAGVPTGREFVVDDPQAHTQVPVQVQMSQLATRYPAIAQDTAVVVPVWLAQWGPSYVIEPIHEQDKYAHLSVELESASGKHHAAMDLKDSAVAAGDDFLVRTDWSTHQFWIGSPELSGGWQWKSGGHYLPGTLSVYAHGVSWQQGKSTYVWQAPVS